jgi:Protein of unknown function (DUF917)
MHLLKQVEQVIRPVLGRTGPALCQDSEHRDHRGRRGTRFLMAIVGLAVISLQKQPGGAEGVRLRRAFRQCYRPHPAVPTNRPTGLPSLLLARSGRQLHNSVLLPKPDLLYRGSTRELALDDIEALAAGAWILSTGGGDSPYLGVLNMRRLYAEGNRRVADVASRAAPAGPNPRRRARLHPRSLRAGGWPRPLPPDRLSQELRPPRWSGSQEGAPAQPTTRSVTR